ncbi:unnamed protein product [Blepharisma stoltei]|uniref:J domain-containing protein n=1 Tax=Blepharisma stoltei TaxID=1481888 RepID=A0AAU9I6U0_9CILI|nr:unnamed protein product [Blepharisma stoltei]
MSKDYYSILKLDHKATDADICKAYRHLAISWHPTNHPKDYVPALNRFHLLAEAYEVLSDPVKRSIYDQSGEFGLKEGINEGNGSFSGGYCYTGNAYKIFENFFGTINPLFEAYGENTNILNLCNISLKEDQTSEEPPKDLIVEIPCTLTELYLGCQKKIDYEKLILAEDSTIRSIKESKTIEIKKGYSKDTKIIFYGKGNEAAMFPSSNLIFQIVELPDQNFKRIGNDLVYSVQISLINAILAEPVHITTLDKRIITVSPDEVIGTKSRKLIENEGMPIFKEIEQGNEPKKFGLDKRSVEKGNLIVKFTVNYPKYIPESSKQALCKLLIS